MALSCNGEAVAVMMATPTDLDDFARLRPHRRSGGAPRAGAGVDVREALDHYAVDLRLSADAHGAAARRERHALEGPQRLRRLRRRVEDVPPPPRDDGAAYRCRCAAGRPGRHAGAPVAQCRHGRHPRGGLGRCADASVAARGRRTPQRPGQTHRRATPGGRRAEGFVVVTGRASYEMVLGGGGRRLLLPAVSAPTAGDRPGRERRPHPIGFARRRVRGLSPHPQRYLPAAQDPRHGAERLVQMANDIAAYFAAEPDDAEAVAGVSATPSAGIRSMGQIVAHESSSGAGLAPWREGVARLAGLDHSPG